METYTSQIINADTTMKGAIDNLTVLLSKFTGTIYITGIGKSSHVARKCVATWQSLGLKAQNLLVQDMPHGDMGILQPGDYIIYMSNSGNTEEIVNVAKYISVNIPVVQVALTANLNSKLKEWTDYDFCISDFTIQESIPTVSCVMFMIVLDQVGINLSNITMNQFKLYHPGGDLGKK